MTDDIFVFDTYAIVEIIEGNKKYEHYLDKEILINSFIFAEICYFLIRKGYPNADEYLDRYKKFIFDIDSDIIKKAMDFRYRNKHTEMSMTDCISYIQAKELGIRFLTGDKEFENMEHVEFVKK
ncbi:MAG: hypothetical protein RL557_149 [archaeon]|jgi:predicted nucleic acid-binding protein